MVDIVKHYGASVIAMVATSIVLAVIYSYLGDSLSLAAANTYKDSFDVYESEDKRLSGEAETEWNVSASENLTTGVLYQASDLLIVNDKSDINIKIVGVYIYGHSGNIIENIRNAESNFFVFNEPGCYVLKVKLVDESKEIREFGEVVININYL